MIALLTQVSIHKAFSQTEMEEEGTKRRAMLGVYGNLNMNNHTLNFKQLTPDCPNCSPGFTEAKGNGIALGGLYEAPMSEAIAIQFRLGYAQLGAETSVDERIGQQVLNNNLVQLNTRHKFSSNIGVIGIEPLLSLRPIQGAGLDINLGPVFSFIMTKKFSQQEDMLTEGFTFSDGSKTRNKFDDREIPDPQSLFAALQVGLSYDIPLGTSLVFAPEASYIYPLTKFSGGNSYDLPNSSAFNFSNNSIRVGAALKFALGEGEPEDNDWDKDGLTNEQEIKIYKTNPRNPDTDGDGLKDGQEVNSTKTDPKNPDTDGDGLKDGDEVNNIKTDPLKPDTDGDGLKDGDEVNQYRTNPLNVDTDGDGLQDGDEVTRYKTDPKNPDTDGDGLKDGDEVKTYNTDPTNKDTDGDNLKDGDEVNGNHPNGSFKTDPTKKDTDGDGVQDDVDKCPLEPGSASAKGCKPVRKGEKLSLADIRFQKNSTEIDFGYEGTSRDLDKLYKFLNACEQVKVNLTGHASKEGNPAKNKTLSDGRAKRVRDYMISKGIPSSRIVSAIGMGSSKPAVQEPTPNPKAEAKMSQSQKDDLENIRKQNRRIEAESVQGCD